MPSARMSVLAGLLLILARPLIATVVYSHSSDRGILLGSDGVQTRTTLDGKVVGKSRSCKIRQFGDFVVAHAGLSFQGGTTFDFWDSVGKVHADTAREFVESLGSLLEPKLREIAELRKATNPDKPDFLRTPRVEILVAGWKPEPTLVRAYYWLGADGSPRIGKPWTEWPPDYPSDWPAERVGKMRRGLTMNSALGQQQAMESGVLDPFLEPADQVRAHIRQQIKMTPESVGEPITLVHITKDGPRWLELGACEGESPKNQAF